MLARCYLYNYKKNLQVSGIRLASEDRRKSSYRISLAVGRSDGSSDNILRIRLCCYNINRKTFSFGTNQY